MRTLWFETHATTLDNLAGRMSGHAPGTLAPVGEEQARALGRRLGDRGVTRVLTSDLARATRTVDLARLADGVVVVHDPGLRECDAGAQTGGPTSVLHADETYLDEPHPGGESWCAAVERNRRTLVRLVAGCSDDVVAVVGHRATWAALEVLAGAVVADAVLDPRPWRPGWRYEVPRDDRVDAAPRPVLHRRP